MDANRSHVMIEVEPVDDLPEKNYLCWDEECGWRLYSIEDIKQAIEHHHYSGYGQPTKYFELDDDKGEQIPVSLVFIDHREDDNDYGYSRYRLGTEEFTVSIDLRA